MKNGWMFMSTAEDLPKNVNFWFNEEFLGKLTEGYEQAFGSTLGAVPFTLIIHVESPKRGVKDAAVQFDFVKKQLRYTILERDEPDEPKNGALISGKPEAWQAAYDKRSFIDVKKLDIEYNFTQSKNKDQIKNTIVGFFAAALRVAQEFNFLPS